MALGRTVTNPVNGEQIPMFVADYVLMEYGTGAIMAVPAHDERDYEFAERLRPRDPARGRVRRRCPAPATGRWSTRAASTACTTARPTTRSSTGSRRRASGSASVNYRLRDWLLSRQRYWGCPIPIVHCDEHGSCRCPDDQLPVELPDVEDYAPKGSSPLAAAEDWVNTDLPGVRQAGAARDRHDGHVRRLVLVLPALLRPPQRRGAVGPRGGRLAGCRSTSTSAASSTRSCTCSTRASS